MKIPEFHKIYKIQFLLLIFIFSFSNQLIYAQRNLKYKDVFKAVEEKSREEVYSTLLVYQKQDPFFANTYLQLGLLAQFWSKDYDALIDLRDVEFFIYNTNLYYGLALSKIKDESKKNNKYYLNIERFKGRDEVDYGEVKSFIQEQLDANKEYGKNVQIVTSLFNSCINHYNNCVRIFKEINTNNNKIKDIYLTANAKFMSNLSELESSFDSTIYYLQNYQTAINNYPIKNYHQKYILLPIETYRLHGLTEADFLKDEIPIWNYGVWVKNVKNILNTDIADLRNQINKADQKLNENISFLADTKDYKSDHPRFKVDEKLINKIGKYDFQSILHKLLKFKESKIDFLANSKDPINDPLDTIAKFTLLNKARYYESLLNSKKYCDSLNKDMADNMNAYDINKYIDFFNMNYGGEAGLKNYLKNENSFLKSQFKLAQNNLKEYLVQSISGKEKTIDNIYYKNTQIEFCPTPINFDNSKPETCYILDCKENVSGDFYFTGYIKEGNNPFYSFIAKTNKKTDIKWLKIIPSNQAFNSTGLFVQAKEDGCDVLCYSPQAQGAQNQIISFTTDGKQKDKIDISITSFPRYFSFDEINQKYTIIFKGFKHDQFECLDDDLIVLQYDVLVKKEIWTKTLKLKGAFSDILTMDQNLVIITNFTEYQSELGYVSSNAGKSPKLTNAMIFIIDQQGSIIKELPILNDKPFYISNSLKINSNKLNLMGFRNELTDIHSIPKDNLGELVYLLLDANGNLYYDNSINQL